MLETYCFSYNAALGKIHTQLISNTVSVTMLLWGRFQISKFGPRHRHPHNKSKTFFSKTHWTPNILKIKLHNSKSMLQQIKRWFIVSPLQQHIQHLLTIEKPTLMRFSQRIFFWGALVLHMAFQEKRHRGWALTISHKKITQWTLHYSLTSTSSYHSPPQG